jgi:hypothetical protein
MAGTATVVALEAIRVNGISGVLLVHILPEGILNAVRELVGHENGSLNGFDVGALAPELTVSPCAPLRSRSLPQRGDFPACIGILRYPRWAPVDQWLWALGSRTSEEDYPPDPARIASQDEDRVRLSADWSGMVLRDGMSLIGTRADRSPSDPYYGYAALYARTITPMPSL